MAPIKVVVFGATGNQGGSVVEALAKDSKYQVWALTRSTASERVLKLMSKYPNVKWYEADVNSSSSVANAVANADVVFAMTQYFAAPKFTAEKETASNEIEQGQCIIDECIKANVKFLIFSTLPSAAKVSKGEFTQVKHFEDKYEIQQMMEQKCQRAGMKWAVVQPAVYFQNIPTSARWDEQNSLIFGFFGIADRKLPYLDVDRDFGPIVKCMIDQQDQMSGQVIPAVSGYYSPSEIVEAFSAVTGIKASAIQVPFEFLQDLNLRGMFEFLEKYDMYAETPGTCPLPLPLTTPKDYWKRCRFHGPPKKL
ncbi:hypothetical protein LPJ78_003679 [Coemansia sp. RSA 989]|nr:hypothetical protein BX667DRAFT_506838 [Coemansia mojavensis]KAJ1741535.1 hypothetical protein LPJ68_002766 [Coemansia sp. RSA 1086]KAJ1749778.1 hypothetical protein LPJ79_003459 [Coemansia sp. RSA 1821]KAJ1864003.1 hypothetical protein LPJ78_003679 [Coemansia sp. RSA 989]KAJ1871714.1 hypothetical protein LPJ55_003662 [Coemansia sp. RSA 990]KAJ2630007.1 hypothetical protein H4R22_002964 [Coemansia sp. RSA 1290]KAJ2648211.1 hypothetical protein IWW40_004082 [Coemansia sp. RSA 1250]KAJ26701